ncbi:ShlB/FhaC/HecB family hemolysin secretion/activation protein [Brasilonema sp. UFV-L1]|uniref:ShlB/FhaC/HecB family hemolysin secretion/activation protein n=1 Tax=Brasilonema sp. UFV-L1 TaxID=2234130 RepID=UPI00145F7A5E|nr:ShlB/FhaC/HecB family hemolysin secretion/activation protein [Brasilonema sp. UFV-L1]NMG10928.1 ShlB/FhaC/HecB family hemolysin secretion/activation protein [Brasilonema sp. UFV-L1]
MLGKLPKKPGFYQYWYCLSLVAIIITIPVKPLQAQVLNTTQISNEQHAQTLPQPTLQRQNQPPSTQPLPEQAPPERLPPPEKLLPPPTTTPPSLDQPTPSDVPQTITVKTFEVTGSTVFRPEDFAKITAPYTNRPITLAELFEVRTKITQLYVDKGYITSGAFIPTQKLLGGVVEIRIVEGGLEDIKISGTRRLNPGYVRSRIALATGKPLNRERLLEALQLLQLNPLISNLSAELSTGSRPGVNLLEVRVQEAETFDLQILLDNGRSPAVGSFRRQIQLSEANLFGWGDRAIATYTNTDGSNTFDFSYSVPFNARNGTVSFSFGFSDSDIIERRFSVLDIQSDSRYYELTLRQPIIQSPTQELALGLSATHRESKASLLNGEIPFSSAVGAFGADDSGKTRVSAVRFFQEWTQRSTQQVLAFRSQFSLGLDAFDANSFFAWRGQGQWVRLLARDTVLLLRADVQLADRPLVPLEQFSLGGIESVRGYRQDALLTDNGIFASAEVRIPIVRFSQDNSVLQVSPFFDVGTSWNRSGRSTSTNSEAEDNTLVSAGLGLRLQLDNWLTARFDWGLPIISISDDKNTWQENGLYFSIIVNPF